MPPKTHLFGPLPLSSTFLVPPTIGLQIWESFLCFLAAASSPFPFPLPPSKLLTFQNTRTLFFFFDIYHREFFQLIYNPFFLDPLHSIHTTPKEEKKNSRRLQEQKNSFLVTLILIYQLYSLSRGGHRLYVESFKEGILTSMGEAPAFFADSFLGDFPNGVDLKSKGHETAVCVGSKIYVIGGDDHESTAVFGVRIFDKSSGEWINPTVLGNKPKLSSGHSAVLLHGDRILVIKGNSKSDDCFWFLEVGTPFIREQEKPHGNEVVAWSRGVLGNVEKPIVISGPSGVGKGTLISKLMKEFPSMFGFSVSHTTRAPREKEQNSVHYHFSDRSVMERDIKDGKFLEFASVHGNLYGTSIEAVEVVADAGKRCILDIDVQGARSVRASSLDAIFIFISPPSFEELEKRLRARATETEEQIQKRLRNAKTELEEGKSSGLFDHILVNDDLESCYENLKNILGLTEGAKAACITYPELVDLPVEPLVSKLDQKILITSDAAEYQKASDNMYVLDLSLLKGGAPGRTRGLSLYVTNPSADRVNDDNQLS